jgi:hypothetical protein
VKILYKVFIAQRTKNLPFDAQLSYLKTRPACLISGNIVLYGHVSAGTPDVVDGSRRN